jgi:flavin reductase (DIM6/NTAB) family NADH-FMN oxidoreductase RutF
MTNANAPQPVNPDELRNALRFWTTGVSVVTSIDQEQRHGMTVSSFASLSLTPPVVMICLERTTRTYSMVIASGTFGVTILGSGQREISERFAGRIPEDGDRFAGLETHALVTGSPFISGGLAFLDCRVVAQHEVGANTYFIGEVVAAQARPDADRISPLLYFNRDYRELLGL